MEKENKINTYESTTVLGKLYKDVLNLVNH